jgi:hypothetical protein
VCDPFSLLNAKWQVTKKQNDMVKHLLFSDGVFEHPTALMLVIAVITVVLLAYALASIMEKSEKRS